jgi:hypothetical protein
MIGHAHFFPNFRVHLGGDGKKRHADGHSDYLTDEKMSVPVARLHLDDRARAIDGRETERQQNAGEHDEDAGLETHVPAVYQICRCFHCASFAYASVAASARKRSPLSS